MKKTGLLLDERFLAHITGLTHPESPERLRVILSALEASGLLKKTIRIPATSCEMKWLELVHTKSYIEKFKTHCLTGEDILDYPDNKICPDTYNTAVLSVGGILNAARMVMEGELDNAFCAVRPPGHHAEPEKAIGFCFFANVAVAAKYILNQWDVHRIGIIDFDVHHGNGTQHIFEQDASVFYYSVHEHPSFAFPGTGRVFEKGEGPGKGYTRNYALLPGQGDEAYKTLVNMDLIPVFDEYKPEVILISAGFDAHIEDIMSRIKLTTDGFSYLMEKIVELAEKHCNGRLISVLEGGYSLKRLPELITNHIRILLGEPPIPGELP